MEDLAQFLASGLGQGAIYGMVGVGFVLIYKVTGIINFAQGEYLMLGAMSAVAFQDAGLPLPAALVAATAVAAVAGALTQRLAIRPARQASTLTLIIITIGVAIAIQGLALLLFGVNPRRFGPFTAGPPLRVLGAAVSRQTLWVLGFAVAVAGLLWWWFERTQVGKAMQACAMDREASRLQGISPTRMSLYAFLLAASIAGAAGVVLVPITSASYDMGLFLAVKGFTAAVIGGLVSTFGAILGGLLLGAVEAMAAGYISSGLANGIAFGMLFLILVVRPEGLLSRGRIERV